MKASTALKKWKITQSILLIDLETQKNYRIVQFAQTRSGCAYGEVEIPVPIPNTEVKHLSGDGTAGIPVGE